MDNGNGNHIVIKQRQEQMLKLVTQSFYRELVNYGVDIQDIVTVTNNLLDHATGDNGNIDNNKSYYNKLFTLKDVDDRWQKDQSLCNHDVTIRPMDAELIPHIEGWLKQPDTHDSFIGLYPTVTDDLRHYFFERLDHYYFTIFHNDQPVGFIGADNIDEQSHKLEMKKFIGDPDLRGKGIGKRATFLFLYYCFRIKNLNKVYIHSMDTNIRNINLNSKFGFELEGVFFEEIFLDDQYRDVVRMGLLRSRWEQIFNPQK